MEDNTIVLLKTLTDTSESIYNAKRNNINRIDSSKTLNKDIKVFFKYNILGNLDEPLDILRGEIIKCLNIIPVYKSFLKQHNDINIYDASRIITLIQDIDRFDSFDNLLSYSGMSPRKRGNSELYKCVLKIGYKLSHNNEKYMLIYDNSYNDYKKKHPKYNEKHLRNMAKRKVIKSFLKQLYYIWKDLNESEKNIR